MIYISPLSAVEQAIDELRPSCLVSLLDPARMISTPPKIKPDCHLRLSMDDVGDSHARAHGYGADDDITAPSRAHIDALIAFVDRWAAMTPHRPLLVHCLAGVSRSTAAAFITLCRLNPETDEHALAHHLRACVPHAWPNQFLVRLADDALKRSGRMCAALQSMSPPRAVFEGYLVGVPLHPDET